MAEEQALRGLEAFDDVKRAIVVAAHADDMETLMGGTLIQLRRRGVEFSLLLATNGDLGSNEPQWTRESLAAARVAEAQRAADLLGVGQIERLGYHDGELEPTLTLRSEIARAYRHFAADTLFTFDPTGWVLNHPDHRAVGRAALDALIPASMRLYQPGQLSDAQPAQIKQIFLWTSANADVYVDVTADYDAKFAACLAHASQFPEAKRLDWMRRMDGERGQRIGVECAEAFQALRTY